MWTYYQSLEKARLIYKIVDRYKKRYKELGYKVKDTLPIMINLLNNKL